MIRYRMRGNDLYDRLGTRLGCLREDTVIDAGNRRLGYVRDGHVYDNARRRLAHVREDGAVYSANGNHLGSIAELTAHIQSVPHDAAGLALAMLLAPVVNPD